MAEDVVVVVPFNNRFAINLVMMLPFVSITSKEITCHMHL